MPRITEGEATLDCPHEGLEHLLGQEQGAQSQKIHIPTKEEEEREKNEENREEGMQRKRREETGRGRNTKEYDAMLLLECY